MSEIEQWWLDLLGLPPAALQQGCREPPPHVEQRDEGQQAPARRVHAEGEEAARTLVQHIYGAIQEYGGFDEPAWLDGPTRKPAAVDA